MFAHITTVITTVIATAITAPSGRFANAPYFQLSHFPWPMTESDGSDNSATKCLHKFNSFLIPRTNPLSCSTSCIQVQPASNSVLWHKLTQTVGYTTSKVVGTKRVWREERTVRSSFKISSIGTELLTEVTVAEFETCSTRVYIRLHLIPPKLISRRRHQSVL
nr:hypothetical protein HmN_000768200 [Hymenolepis microstoma]